MASQRRSKYFVDTKTECLSQRGPSASAAIAHSGPHAPEAELNEDQEDDVPFSKAAKYLQPHPRQSSGELIAANPDQASFPSLLPSPPADEHSPYGATYDHALQDKYFLQDTDYYSDYESDASSEYSTDSNQASSRVSPHELLVSLGVVPPQPQPDDDDDDDTLLTTTPDHPPTTQAHSATLRPSTIHHLPQTPRHPAIAAPIPTLLPDAAFRANPQHHLRAHLLTLHQHWAQTRDVVLAAPLQASWWDHEQQLQTQTARMRRESASAKLLPRRLYHHAAEWLAARRGGSAGRRRRR